MVKTVYKNEIISVEQMDLKDENGNWINPPNDDTVAIIWAGDIATKINPEIKHGIHRVINNGIVNPRIAIWHEICTSAQEHRELIYGKSDLKYKSLIDPVKFEGETGIPMSKSRS